MNHLINVNDELSETNAEKQDRSSRLFLRFVYICFSISVDYTTVDAMVGARENVVMSSMNFQSFRLASEWHAVLIMMFMLLYHVTL